MCPIGRREEFVFTGSFDFGAGAADPTMDPAGGLAPQVALAISEPGVMVTAVFTESGAEKLIASLQAALRDGHSAIIVPGNGRR
jgi:hypothetical protein